MPRILRPRSAKESIDLIIPIFKNYTLAHRVVNHIKQLDEKFNIIIIDTTPPEDINDPKIPGVTYVVASLDNRNRIADTTMHGEAIDQAKIHTKTDIIGIMDADFFWFNPHLFDLVKEMLKKYECVGASSRNLKSQEEGGYMFSHWMAKIVNQDCGKDRIDTPAVWGMFIRRELAMSMPFHPGNSMEPGNTIRRHVRDSGQFYSWHGYPAADESWKSEPEDMQLCVQDAYFYGSPFKPCALHMFGGCHYLNMNRMSAFMEATERLIQKGKSLWVKNKYLSFGCD